MGRDAKPAGINTAQLQADLAKLRGGQAPSRVKKDAVKKEEKVEEEEYDPLVPNDYDALCKDRIRRKAEEEMEKRRRLEEEKANAKNEPELPKGPSVAEKMMQ